MAKYEANQTYIWRDQHDSDIVCLGHTGYRGELAKIASIYYSVFVRLWGKDYEARMDKITTTPTKVRLVVEPE